MLSDFEDSDSESNQNVNTSQRLKDLSKRSTVNRSRAVKKPVVTAVEKEEPLKTDALSNLRNLFSNKQNSGCDVVPTTQNKTNSSSAVVGKLDSTKDHKSKESSKENKLGGQRKEERSRNRSRRDCSMSHKGQNKKSRIGGESLIPSQNANSLNNAPLKVAVEPIRVVHNDLFSDSDDNDTPKYDVYSLARLFQGQVTENFRSLNAHILDLVVADTEEVDNELYCLCR
jgi:hypothetical protein